jgi:hypothetical protein
MIEQTDSGQQIADRRQQAAESKQLTVGCIQATDRARNLLKFGDGSDGVGLILDVEESARDHCYMIPGCGVMLCDAM